MSRMTSTKLRELFIYQVYIRNHTEEGTFEAFNGDLDRIKNLGVDVVYFMPIHEIGQKKKKGQLGCPYSIKDYRSINHEYGTIEDFKNTITEIHSRGMKVMIDVVYNHTSYDSVLIEEHPEYFYKKDGEFANRVGDWWDITDLDYTVSKDLWTELIDTLVYWTNLGVDGFRFDVASILPFDFLEMAHEAVLDVNPNTIFLSESVHGGFVTYLRKNGFSALSENEIYQVFDMAYDYDTHPYFEGFLKGEVSFKRYLEELVRQEEIYPENYIKMRNLENHDFGRFTSMVNGDIDKIHNWTSMMFFQKGSTMIYSGQEFCDTNRPDLFDVDPVNWNGEDISELVMKLSSIVKNETFSKGFYTVKVHDLEVFVGEFEDKENHYIGIFNVGLEEGNMDLECPNGKYTNLINGEMVEVEDNRIRLLNNPIIIKVK